MHFEHNVLCQPVSDDVDELFFTYDSVLRDVADRFTTPFAATLNACRRRGFDADCRTARHNCRRLERCYRRTLSLDDRRSSIIAV